MENCIFCRIIKGEIPCDKVWEDDRYLGFLDINPIKVGHTLIIPKEHVPYFFDMEDDYLEDIIKASKTVSHILKKAFRPKSGKVGMLVYGLEIDHAHIHLVPLDKAGDLSLANRHSASREELNASLEQIKAS